MPDAGRSGGRAGEGRAAGLRWRGGFLTHGGMDSAGVSRVKSATAIWSMNSVFRFSSAAWWRAGRGWCGANVVLVGLGVGAVRADPDDLLIGTVQALDEAGEGVGTLATFGVRPTSFAVIGDYGTGTIVEARVAEMVRQWNPDFVVTVGDNNYGPLSPEPADFDPPVTFWTRFVGAFYGQFILRRVDGRYGDQTSRAAAIFPGGGEPRFTGQ